MFSCKQHLMPICAEQPCGDDLAFSGQFDDIVEARRFDDRSIDQGAWTTELKDANWGGVVARCSALLEHRSKDLRLAVWLVEAAAKQYQLRGLGEGLQLVAGLFEQYWDLGLHPASTGDEHERRIDNLAWLLQRIPALVRETPVTDGIAGPYCLNDYDAAGGDATLPQNRLVDLESARDTSSDIFRKELVASARACLDALETLELAAARRLGAQRPGFAGAREALQALLHFMRAPSTETAAGPVAPGQDDSAGPHCAAGAPATRAQAIAQLRVLAAFFRRTEPHSPVSYFSDKAAAAGELALHEWLRTVIKDPASLAHVEELLGVSAQDNPS